MTDVVWTDLAAACLIGAGFVVLPGLLVGWATRLRGFLLVAVAPGLSTSAIAVGAVAGDLVGLPWSWWVPLVTAVGMAAVVWATLRLARRFGLDVSPRPVDLRRDLTLALGVGVAALLLVRQLTVILGRPDAISQTFDNIFHLAAVRYAAETGHASSLTISGVNDLEGNAYFYPAAFHGVASLVLQYGVDDIAVAVNATAVLITALIWPLGALALVRLVLPENAAGVLGAGVLAASFTVFPIFLLEFGILYPNLFGLALLPVMYGLMVQLLGLHARRHVPPATAGVLLLGMLPGVVLAHPNALMVLVATAFAPVAAWFVRSWRAEWSSRRRIGALVTRGAVATGFVVGSLVAWQVVRPPSSASIWSPILTAPHAVGEAVMNANPGGGRAAWVLSVVVVAGIYLALGSGRWWLVGSWATVVGLWVVVASFAVSDLRDYLTGIWYNDPWRFSATIPLVALPLGALALHELGARLVVMTRGVSSRVSAPEGTRRALTAAAGAAVTAGMVAVLAIATQTSSAMRVALDGASWAYALTPISPLLTEDEYALIRRAGETLDEDAVVATNPWNGSSMLYALTGIRTTTTHAAYRPTDDQRTLRYELDTVAESPAACDAVTRTGVTHVLDFGIQEVHGGDHPYPGLLGLDEAPGFREVDREGSVALFELTACR